METFFYNEKIPRKKIPGGMFLVAGMPGNGRVVFNP
jgi:hypothetical protein